MKKYLFSLVAMGVSLTSFYGYAEEVKSEASAKTDVKTEQVAEEAKNKEVESITNVETIKVGNETVNLKEFIGKLDSMFAQTKDAKGVSKEEKETFYRSMVYARLAEVLFCNAAKELGLDKDAVIKDQIDMMKNQILARAYMQKVAVGRITERSILDEYKEYEKEFPKAGIEIGNILLKDKATADKVIKELNAGKKFADLAKEYSIAASKNNGGKESVIPVDGLPANMKQLVGMKDGEYVKEPIQTQAGFHVISVLSHQQIKAQPLNDVRKVIENIVLKKEMDKVVKTLLSTATILAYDSNGNTVDILKLLETGTPSAEAKEQVNEVKASEVKVEPTKNDEKVGSSEQATVGENEKPADAVKADGKKNVDSKDDGFMTRVWTRVKNLF